MDWSLNPPSNTLQFSSLTVNAGQTLTVPSGLTIRVAGPVNIAGTLVVNPNPFPNTTSNVHLGSCATGTPSNASTIAPGVGGVAFSLVAARQVVGAGIIGGSNGGGVNTFGSGGGALRLFAAGAITIASGGSIVADGARGVDGGSANSGGGGAGGIVILASSTSIVNEGNISAVGGGGGNGVLSPARGAGGGGGGGVVHLISPSITAGTLTLTGGAGGTGGSGFSGAAGGGGCGGNGGASGQANGEAGSVGRSFTTIVTNPASFILR